IRTCPWGGCGCSSSSDVVTMGWRLTGVGRALSELAVDVAGGVAPAVGDLDLVAGLVGAHGGGDILGRLALLAVDGRDHVALAQPGHLGARSGGDVGDERPRRGIDPESRGDRG